MNNNYIVDYIIFSSGPILKLKRSVIMQNHADEIEELYGNTGLGLICT